MLHMFRMGLWALNCSSIMSRVNVKIHWLMQCHAHADMTSSERQLWAPHTDPRDAFLFGISSTDPLLQTYRSG